MDIRIFVKMIANMKLYGREMKHNAEDATELANALIKQARSLVPIIEAAERDELAFPNFLRMNDRELNTILHGLRCLQNPDESESCDHFDESPSLSTEEIDALCERMTLSPDKFAHLKKIQDGYFCFYHTRMLPTRHCPDCAKNPPERWPWMDGMDPEEASHYYGLYQECQHCAGTDGKHLNTCPYAGDNEYIPTNYFNAEGVIVRKI